MDKTGKIIAITMECLVLALCLGLSIFVLWTYLNDAKKGEYYRENGGQTTATVTKARSYTETLNASSRKNKTIVSYCDFTIEYMIDGEDYTVSFKRYQDAVYTKGDIITVYYLDSDPVGSLRLYLEPPPMKYIIFGVTPVIIGAAFLIDILKAIRALNNTQK